MRVKSGERVGAINCVEERDGKVVAEFFGYGVYLGEKVPETEDVRFFGISLKKANHENPCILLDSGKKVYGYECWWGPEDYIRNILERCNEIIMVDIEELRRKKSKA